MELRLKLFAVLLGVAFALLVIQSIRSARMRPSFAWMWLLIALFLISIPLFEPVYKWISVGALGIDDARTIVYVPLIGFLLVYAFYMTLVMTRLSDQVQELISQTAVMESELASLSDRSAEEDGTEGPA